MRKYKLLRLYTELRERACFHNPSKAKRLIILEVSKQIGEKNTSIMDEVLHYPLTRCVDVSMELERDWRSTSTNGSTRLAAWKQLSGTIHGDQMPHAHDLETELQPASSASFFYSRTPVTTHSSLETRLRLDAPRTGGC